MTQFTREDALSFIEAIRLTVAGKAGFKWLDEKLSRLRDYVEELADENESYRAHLEETGTAVDFESFRSAEKNARDIDEYIAAFPDETRQALESVRALVREILPEGTETISYAIPTFDLDGHHVVHFAGYPKHVGIYPIPHGAGGTPEELKPFQHGKGTARFPLDQPLPMPVIRTMVEALVAEARARSRG